MFHLVTKQFLSGYVPMQVAGSVEEAVDLIASIEGVQISDVCGPFGGNTDEAGNTFVQFQVDKPSRVARRHQCEYYKVITLYRS